MPVTKSAKKKLRQDKKRELKNFQIENLLKQKIKKAKKEPTVNTLREAIKITDKASKKRIIAKNKAARIKSNLSKLLNNKKNTSVSSESKTPKIKK